MTKSRTLVLALALSLSLSVTGSAPPLLAPSPGPDSPVLGDVQGNGWGAILACAGCVAGGILLIKAGWVAIAASARVRGSTAVVGACVAACAEAFD